MHESNQTIILTLKIAQIYWRDLNKLLLLLFFRKEGSFEVIRLYVFAIFFFDWSTDKYWKYVTKMQPPET